MPGTDRANIFDQNLPQITEADAQKAALSDKVVVSFDTLPYSEDGKNIAFLAVKFSFPDKGTETVLFDRFACMMLCGAASAVETGNWLIAPGQKRR